VSGELPLNSRPSGLDRRQHLWLGGLFVPATIHAANALVLPVLRVSEPADAGPILD
jgi:hypothetical protein